MFEGGGLFGDDDEPGGSTGGITVERGPLIEDKVFVDSDELYWIGIHLSRAYAALGEAVACHRDLERRSQEYCDEGQFQELDSATLDALGDVEKAWQAVCVVTDAHEAQLRDAEDEDDAEDDGDEDEDDQAEPHDEAGASPPMG